MDQPRRARVGHGARGRGGIDVGGRATARPLHGLVRLAAFAQGAGLLQPLRQGLCQKRRLPGRGAHLGAKRLIVAIVQAPGVAVAEQPTHAAPLEPRRVGQPLDTRGGGKGGTQQKVTVAVHHVHGPPTRQGADRARLRLREGDLGVEGRVGRQHVVAHPYLEQVTQNQQRIERGGSQVRQPSACGCWVLGVQVHVRHAVDAAPGGRRIDAVAQRGDVHGRRRCAVRDGRRRPW
jgi:hypothetical protein